MVRLGKPLHVHTHTHTHTPCLLVDVVVVVVVAILAFVFAILVLSCTIVAVRRSGRLLHSVYCGSSGIAQGSVAFLCCCWLLW